jgi:hypothetical protein
MRLSTWFRSNTELDFYQVPGGSHRSAIPKYLPVFGQLWDTFAKLEVVLGAVAHRPAAWLLLGGWSKMKSIRAPFFCFPRVLCSVIMFIQAIDKL